MKPLKKCLNTFNSDLKYGEAIEQYVLKRIQNKYPSAYKQEGYFKDYDIFIPEIEKGIEVKGDYMSCVTGNIVVEINFNGKPSALKTTKADYWIFVDGYYLIIITPEELKNHIRKHKYKTVFFVGNGDTKEKEAYLINKWRLKKESTTIKIESTSNIYGEIKKGDGN